MKTMTAGLLLSVALGAIARGTVRRSVCILLFAIAAGCGHETVGPPPPTPPPPTPTPPSPNEGLWSSSAVAPSILRLAPDQLRAGATVFAAATSITTSSAGLSQRNSVAFDADGTLWIASSDDSRLLAFAPAALESSGARAATVIIQSTDGSLNVPAALAFDRQHRLWVANAEDGTIVRFDPAQLASSGAPVPAVVVSGVAGPRGLAFDAAGALWTSEGPANAIAKYGAAQLAASGRPTPDVVLSATENSIDSPSGLAIDAAGNLWVANSGGQTVVAFNVSQLATGGTSAPHIVLAPSASSASIPVGLAFDGDGSLWVISMDGVLVKYDRTVLGATGTPPPSTHLVFKNSVLFWNAAFWPRPAGLPLN